MRAPNPYVTRETADLRTGTALDAGCDTLWSEDMQHGMKLDEGLRIANPFRGA